MSIERDSIIEDIYKKDINESIQTIKILSSTDISFPIDIAPKEYQKFILKEYWQYRLLFREIKNLRLSKYNL